MRDRFTGETVTPARRSDVAAALSPVALLVRRHDRDRFQTALFAPAAEREALFALYAFNYEIARVRESVSEPMLGQIRLQWWREAIDAVYGAATPRRHEVVEALGVVVRARALSRNHFARLIDSRERDLDDAPPKTLAALEEYAEGT
jgi:NADH dehydrogenase [ubiquinone] 1 alpha subcomplex assembly factor 6